MADFSALKTSIQNYIKQNGNNEITGAILQQILLSMVTALGDNAINDLVAALGEEVSARQHADGTLQDNINSEATTRSQADGTLQQNINSEANTREHADGVLSGLITAEEEARIGADNTLRNSINSIIADIEHGYVYAGIATPSTTPSTGKIFYLALTAGTYTNFGATVVTQGINILKRNGSAWVLDSFLGLDNVPTQGSNNLVKSGGVLDSIIKDGSAFDLSAYNSGTTYADLSAALTALNALPAAFKKGGMSMKFVLSSDNKYVQYRNTDIVWTTDITKWVKDNVDYSLVEDEEHLVSIEKDGTPLSPQVIGRDFMLDSKYSLLDAESTISKRGYYAMANNVPTYYDNSNFWCWEMDVADYANKYLYFNAPGFYRLLLFNDNTLIRDARLTYTSNIHILLPSNITKMYLSVTSSYKDSAEVSYIIEGLKTEQNVKFYNINQINTKNLGVEYGSKDVPIPQFVEPHGEYYPVTGVYKFFTNMAYDITRPCYVDVIMNPCELKETYFVEYNNDEVINLHSITPTKLEVMKVHLPFRVSKGSRIYVSNVGMLSYTGNNVLYIQKSSVIAIGDKNLETHSVPDNAIQYKLELRYCGINESTDNLDERIKYLESKESALKNKKWAIIGDSRSAWMYNETPYYALIAQYLGGFTLSKSTKEILNSNNEVQFDAKGTNGSYVTRFIYQNEGQNPALLDRITITPDIISVYMGTNDFLMSTPLGEITDNDDDYPTKPHTYYGTLRKAILSIYAKFPNSMVVFMSPAASKGYSTAPDSNVPNLAGHMLADYVQAMKEVCGEYSIPVVDIFHDGDYTPFIESQRTLYYQDGLHESTLGHKRIANLLMPVLNNMLTID